MKTLEKEALSKGVPIGQAVGIDIPPPRPKRKPRNPYPRKTCTGVPTSQIGAKDGKVLTSMSSLCCKKVLDLEKEPISDRPNGDEKQTYTKENQDDSFSEIFTVHQEGYCSSVSAENKNSIPTPVGLRNSCTFTEFVPCLKEVLNQDETYQSYVTAEIKGNGKFDKPDANQARQANGTSEPSNLESFCHLHDKPAYGEKADHLTGAEPTDEMQATQNYPRHVTMHSLDGSLGAYTQNPSDMPFQESVFRPMGEIHGNPNLFTNPVASATAENQRSLPRFTHQPFPTFHPPFSPFCLNQDDYRSFLHISSTFSSLIMSTLLQNPAAHSAASFAATFWPYANMQTSADSPACPQGVFSSRQTSSHPSVAAIAAATVAAATAWWAAHGLLPLCAPLHGAFTFPPTSAIEVSSMDTAQVPKAKTQKKDDAPPNPFLEDQQLEPEYSEAVQAQNSASKSPTISSSDFEESDNAKFNNGSKDADQEKAAEENELQDSNKTKNRKQVDRSSCGSNTPSSSEVETDALEKHEKGKEDPQEVDANQAATDSSNRRSRSSSNASESWKEVSEEGRLAFQALFSREVLPQSFSRPHGLKSTMLLDNIKEDRQNGNEKDADTSLLDLNSKTWDSCSGHQEVEKSSFCRGEDNEGLLTIGLGHGKLKARRTGFKPYKRYSVEAKENLVMYNGGNQPEEKGTKRIRLDGDV